jgi:MFS family permease
MTSTERAGQSGTLPSWVTRGMLGIVLATFFSDVGHEMVTAVLPLYLTSIGLGPGALGVMEGIADFAFSISKLAGGAVGHHAKRKRPLAALGYGLTAVCTTGIAVVSSAVGIGAFRVVAWIGRGFRGPLRDFLLADEVDSTHFGRAYGIERSADMLGAVVGPLVALAMLALGAPLVAVIGVSFLPSVASALSILLFTRDRARDGQPGTAASASHRLPRRFWLLVSGVLVFGLGDFSRTFLIFLVAGAFGGASARAGLTGGVMAYAAHNVVSGIVAFPAGKLADRIPKWRVLVGGYVLGAATNLLLAGGSSFGLAVAVIASGTYIAIEETVEKAAVAELLRRDQRSLGFGILASANAIGDMVSSLYVGTLLSSGRGALAFGIASSCAAAGAAWVFVVGRSAASENQS